MPFRDFALPIGVLALVGVPTLAWAAAGSGGDYVSTPIGILSVVFFVLAYAVVMTEEFTHLRKSKPVVFCAGIIWALCATAHDEPGEVVSALRHNILEFAELFLFLLVAMTYINALTERNVFEALRAWLVRKKFTYRQLFWITGWIAFFLSPVADNLTAALIMCAVVMAVGLENPRFVSVGCINIVVAVNAGGAFSPFGDITTLMVWQKEKLDFFTFFVLFVPSVVNYVIPAALMYLAIPRVHPLAVTETVTMKRGAFIVMGLFLATIATAVCFHSYWHLPPMLGMMTGLSYLQFFAYYLKKTHRSRRRVPPPPDGLHTIRTPGFDIFRKVSQAEWDTLLFFYGIILCVGGLGFLGHLGVLSGYMYGQLSQTTANSLVGVLSAVVDNIPVMFAVLAMDPEMPEGQWLLVTLTAGVGGSLLSVGSAAGVALMGQARGLYTFFGHLRWAPAIFLGYVASILVHLWINSSRF